MAPRIQPQLDQTSTKQTNLAVLQRQDSDIDDVLGTAGQVTLYSFDVNGMQWARKGVEGSLFVVKRRNQPRFQFIVLNRLSTENMVEDLLSDIVFQLLPPYLLYRNARKQINGIWFYDDSECQEVASLLKRISSAFSHALPGFQAPPLGAVSAPAIATADITLGTQKPGPRDASAVAPLPAALMPQQRAAVDGQPLANGGATGAHPGAVTPSRSGGRAKSNGVPGLQTTLSTGLVPLAQPQASPGASPAVSSFASASVGTSLLTGLLSIGRGSAGTAPVDASSATLVQGVPATMGNNAAMLSAPLLSGPDDPLLPPAPLASASGNAGKALNQLLGAKLNNQVTRGGPQDASPSGTISGPTVAKSSSLAALLLHSIGLPVPTGPPPSLSLVRGMLSEVAIASAAAPPWDEARGAVDGMAPPTTTVVAAPTERPALLVPSFFLAEREGPSGPASANGGVAGVGSSGGVGQPAASRRVSLPFTATAAVEATAKPVDVDAATMGGSLSSRMPPSVPTQGLPPWLASAMGASLPQQDVTAVASASTSASGGVYPVPAAGVVASAPHMPPLPGPAGLLAGLQTGPSGSPASSRGVQPPSAGITREQLKAAMLSLAKDDRFIDLMYQHLSLP